MDHLSSTVHLDKEISAQMAHQVQEISILMALQAQEISVLLAPQAQAISVLMAPQAQEVSILKGLEISVLMDQETSISVHQALETLIRDQMAQETLGDQVTLVPETLVPVDLMECLTDHQVCGLKALDQWDTSDLMDLAQGLDLVGLSMDLLDSRAHVGCWDLHQT